MAQSITMRLLVDVRIFVCYKHGTAARLTPCFKLWEKGWYLTPEEVSCLEAKDWRLCKMAPASFVHQSEAAVRHRSSAYVLNIGANSDLRTD